MHLEQRVADIIENVQKLAHSVFPSEKFSLGMVTIFAQSQDDFEIIREGLQDLGTEEEANNGYAYVLKEPWDLTGVHVVRVRVRMPDVHRKELGCADLVPHQSTYARLRADALELGLDVITRKDFEMIELADRILPVYGYIVSE